MGTRRAPGAGRPWKIWRGTAKKKKELDGGVGARRPLQRPSELVGDRVLRPYAPVCVKVVK